MKDSISAQSEVPLVNLCSSASKHRYFFLSDTTPIFDLKAKALQRDVDEAEQLAAPKPSNSPQFLMKKMQLHLDVRMAQLKEDQKKMQVVHIPQSAMSQDAAQAFKSLKAGDSATVIALVTADVKLLGAVDSTEQSLLHWACKRRMENLAIYLVDKGADSNKKDMGGRSAKDIARRKGMLMLANYMQKARPTFNPKLSSAIFIRKAARKMTVKVRTKKNLTAACLTLY